jgi:hypothetical protein
MKGEGTQKDQGSATDHSLVSIDVQLLAMMQTNLLPDILMMAITVFQIC